MSWETFRAAARPVGLTVSVTQHTGELERQHALCGADDVHLASLLAVATRSTIFAVWDERLRAGAVTAGVLVAPQ